MNIEENLLNKMRELSFNLFEMPDFIKLNTCNYKPSNRIESFFSSHISGEFSSSLANKVLHIISNTQLIDFIDRRGVGNITPDPFSLDPFSINKCIISDIINHVSGYTNIICSVFIASILQDDSRFCIDNQHLSKSKSGYIKHIGYISGIKVWVDPFIKYGDYKILAFNNISVDVNNFYSKIVSKNRFKPMIVIGFDFDVIYDNVKKIYIITDNSGEGWSLFIQHSRNSKINDILYEKK